MILTNFLNNIDYRRRDITNIFISETEKIVYLNEALRKIKGKYDYEWEKVSASVSYTDGSYVYALSSVASDIDEPINVFFSSNYPFTCVSPEEFRQLSSSSFNMWAIDNDSLLLKTTFGSDTLTLNYYTSYIAQTSGGSRTSGLSSSGDSPLIPEIHQDIIVDFAVSRCFQKEQMWDDYRIAMSEFKEALKELQAKTPSRKKHYSKVWGSPRKGYQPNLKDKATL